MPRRLADFPADLAAGAAARLILRHHLDVMEANEAGIIDDVDTEFLHDYRIALRRCRSAVEALRTLLPEAVQGFRDDLRWLGTVTSAARDMDVYLLDFDKLTGLVPAAGSANLDVVHDLIRRHRAETYRDLIGAFKTARYSALKRRLRRALGAPSVGVVEFRPIGLEASRRIRKHYRKTRAEGLAITDDSPAEALHALRKDRQDIALCDGILRPSLSTAKNAQVSQDTEATSG